MPERLLDERISPVTRTGDPCTHMPSQSEIGASTLQFSVAVPRRASLAASRLMQSRIRPGLAAGFGTAVLFQQGPRLTPHHQLVAVLPRLRCNRPAQRVVRGVDLGVVRVQGQRHGPVQLDEVQDVTCNDGVLTNLQLHRAGLPFDPFDGRGRAVGVGEHRRLQERRSCRPPPPRCRPSPDRRTPRATCLRGRSTVIVQSWLNEYPSHRNGCRSVLCGCSKNVY